MDLSLFMHALSYNTQQSPANALWLITLCYYLTHNNGNQIRDETSLLIWNRAAYQANINKNCKFIPFPKSFQRENWKSNTINNVWNFLSSLLMWHFPFSHFSPFPLKTPKSNQPYRIPYHKRTRRKWERRNNRKFISTSMLIKMDKSTAKQSVGELKLRISLGKKILFKTYIKWVN